MSINASVTNQQITASVGESKIDVSVGGGVGPTGTAGAAATVSVGTVTTGAAGSSASVTNVGTSSAAVFNFTIPAGATGATGPAGTTSWAGITDKPSFAAVATSGSASDLTTGTLNAARLPSDPTFSNVRLGIHAIYDDGNAIAFDIADDQNPLDVVTPFFVGYSQVVTNVGLAFGSSNAASSTRTNLGLGGAAVLNVGTSAGTVCAGDDSRLSDARTPTSHSHSASDTTSGTFDIARIPTGTTSTTVAAGNHTHSQLHDRSHAITSTSDHTATAWRVFHSNGSGEVVELALGASGTVLTSGGTSAAPTFSALPSGGTKTYSTFTPADNQPPSTNFATLDTRNAIAVLDFDDATKESAVFAGVIPESASLGSGLKIRIHWMATSATASDVRWEVALERSNTDLDSDSFDTVATGATTTSGTSGIVSVTEITLTTIDSVTAGDLFRLRVARDAANGADTMSGDAELVAVEVRSAA
jgi:hypothetical protein